MAVVIVASFFAPQAGVPMRLSAGSYLLAAEYASGSSKRPDMFLAMNIEYRMPMQRLGNSCTAKKSSADVYPVYHHAFREKDSA